MKWLAAAIGLVFLAPIPLAGTALVMASSSEAAQATGSVDCQDGISTDAVTKRVTAVLDGASGKDVHIKGLTLPTEQIPNAQTIVATGVSLDVPPRGQIVALATAMQESRLRNLAAGDRDSLGLFQQRPSQGWGTAQQIHDPVYASEQFYKHLLKVHGWQQMAVTQAVQNSGYPDAYAQWEHLAKAPQKGVTTTLPNAGKNKPGKESGTGTGTSGCGPAQDRSAYGKIPEGRVPKGYTIPKNAAPKARAAITWALRQLGTPYQWGGTCTNAHGPDPMGRCDCSSLMQQAYAHAGITLTRTTYTQVSEGKSVSTKALQPGDLLFARGSAARPEHVGMYIGAGLVVEAPRTSKPVRITPLKDWTVLAARRVL
ncbi:C40 family peptidase [Streptomyces pinistramenti]|uniref:C40 family peptidase n=1 Tax=Streptomyces pinistramenti TaxID=2884812 RepID=UPI001D069539|nr:C40 family peptidase [Streptomyces pinistramenti]MCB5905855.1 NlpC/P60 family protein [Streptomyces pinistramenti]